MNSTKNNNCPFCNLPSEREILIDKPLAYAIYDKFPVNTGHSLIIPKRHCADYFKLTEEEQIECWSIVNSLKKIIETKYKPQGFNVGININECAGQSVSHVHIHLIPRYHGDVDEPRVA